MSKTLIIVESPAKAKTINKFIGSDYVVAASVGHIRDLPVKELGVDVDDRFQPKYVRIKGKDKVIRELKEHAKNADRILLAADPDREGEAICFHIAHELRNSKKPIFRITYNEITKRAIISAVKNPRAIDQSLVDAQQARRILDRLVGYKISPLLWRSVRPGLSAGRVQSVSVRLICDREAEIEAFEPKEYWTILATLRGNTPEILEAKLLKIGEKKGSISTYGFEIDENDANEISRELKAKNFTVQEIKKTTRKRRSSPPFITSSLQQEASGKLRFNVKRTMSVAQKLYEGIPLGSEGTVGLITYMRTDSTRVADSAISEVRLLIEQNYSAKYLPEKPNFFKAKKSSKKKSAKPRNVQDAHEAIRPTSPDRTPESLKGFLTDEQYKLYELIWRRFVASQMSPALFNLTTIDINADQYLFRATGSTIKFDGFLKVYKPTSRGEDEPRILPSVKKGDKLDLMKVDPKQHFTQPPPRYSEASLVKTLEEQGIGRPSTYAAIVSTIQSRDYVRKEQGRFIPTDLGRLVTELLIGGFPEILSQQFTAELEEKLDQIAEGKHQWTNVMAEFYQPFEAQLEVAPDKMYEARKAMEVESDQFCEKCNSVMIVKWGKWGRFLGCSSYPDCKNIKPLDGSVDEETDKICDKCDSPMVIKKSRTGNRFYACSAYPKCKNAKSIPIGIECPKCGDSLGERHTKRGKPFYGCTTYPDCDFVVWSKPYPKACPKCNTSFMVEKWKKLRCPKDGCDHVEEPVAK